MLDNEGGPPRSLTRKTSLHRLLGVPSVRGQSALWRATLPKDMPREGESGAHAMTDGGHIKAQSSQSDTV